MAFADPEDRDDRAGRRLQPERLAVLPLRGLPAGPARVRLQRGHRRGWAAGSAATRSRRSCPTPSVRRTCDGRPRVRTGFKQRLYRRRRKAQRGQEHAGQQARGAEGLHHLPQAPDHPQPDPGRPQRARIPGDLRGYPGLAEAARHFARQDAGTGLDSLSESDAILLPLRRPAGLAKDSAAATATSPASSPSPARRPSPPSTRPTSCAPARKRCR